MSNQTPGGDLPENEKPEERMPAPGSEMPGAGMPAGMPEQEKASGMALASLILSVAGLLCGITAIVGIVLGAVELGRINRGESSQRGRSMAMAGIIVGAVVLALGIIFSIISIIVGGFSFEVET